MARWSSVRWRIINELIFDGVENGKPEEEIIAGFGAPEEIAAQIRAEYKSQQAVEGAPGQGAVPPRPACLEYPAQEPVHTVVVDARNVRVNVRAVPGGGVRATVGGTVAFAGNAQLMGQHGIDVSAFETRAHQLADEGKTPLYFASAGRALGMIAVADTVKSTSAAAIAELSAMGIRTVMLTGDAKAVGESVAQELGLDEVHTQLLPADKVTRVEALLGEVSPKGALAFVGDGINDAPVLSRADIGIAMGGLGSDAAIEAADIVLMDDKPSKLADAIRIARRTLAIVRQNIVFALAVKFLVLALSAAGVANMWEAVFADVGVSVIAILNAMRALKTVK